MNLKPGTTFLRLTIGDRIERGSKFVSVYQVRESSGRELRLQCVSADLTALFAERFLHDAAILAQLEHPHLLRVYDFGQHEDQCWLVAQVAPRSTLSDLRHGQRLERRRALSILRTAGSAIDYLHANGISHGSLTPHDIRVDDTAVSLDVGAEWIATSHANLADNPHYVCPERLRGEVVGSACDVYALGMITYEILLGRGAFDSDDPFREIARKLSEDLAPPPANQISQSAWAVLRTCLAVDTSRRWPTTTAFIDALEGVLD